MCARMCSRAVLVLFLFAFAYFCRILWKVPLSFGSPVVCCTSISFKISEAWMFLLSSLQWALYTQWVSLPFEFPGDLACLLCKGLNLSLQKKINNNKLMSNNHSLNPVVKVNIRAWQSDISEDFKVPYPRSQGHYKLNYVLPLDMKILRYSFLLNNSLETNFQRP